MRLREVERGDRLVWRLLIWFISLVSGMRLPDAARIVLYHRQFFGDPMSRWTHGNAWGKRLDGRRAGTDGGDDRQVERLRVLCRRAWRDRGAGAGKTGRGRRPPGRSAGGAAGEGTATLAFLEVLTRTPDTLTAGDARTVLRQGITPQALEDAIAVAALFNVIGRCACPGLRRSGGTD